MSQSRRPPGSRPAPSAASEPRCSNPVASPWGGEQLATIVLTELRERTMLTMTFLLRLEGNPRRDGARQHGTGHGPAGFDRLGRNPCLGRRPDPNNGTMSSPRWRGSASISSALVRGRRQLRLMIGSTRTTEPKTEKGIDDYVSPHLDRGDRHVLSSRGSGHHEGSANASSGGAPSGRTPRGTTATVNGLRMYYETRGEGEPLVLLHGRVRIGDGPTGTGKESSA